MHTKYNLLLKCSSILNFFQISDNLQQTSRFIVKLV